MKVSIIKYNAGNTASVQYALKRIGIEASITDDKEQIVSSDKVILPGVGEAKSAMQYLRENQLDDLIRNLKQPLLGICLGMQLLCSKSEEGNTACLGIINGAVKKFANQLKVPHTGWNTVQFSTAGLGKGINADAYFYFVHSYYVEHCSETIATCNYITPFTAALNKNNFYATQFHPEKSGNAGERILKNFLEL